MLVITGLSQRDRVETDLREAGAAGVCSLYWYRSAVPNSRNAISVMRAQGYHIVTEVCADEHGPVYRRYKLIHDAGRRCSTCSGTPEQLALGVAS